MYPALVTSNDTLISFFTSQRPSCIDVGSNSLGFGITATNGTVKWPSYNNVSYSTWAYLKQPWSYWPGY